jgi:hypothetical protein
MEMKLVETKTLKPAKYNPRDISEDAFEGLKNSIKEFGVVDPFIVNKTTGNLVGGHQRLKAVKELKLTKVPVIYISLDKHREKILNVTLNNPQIAGYYTKDLRQILEDIKIDLPEFDYDAVRMNTFDHLILDDIWNNDFTKVDKSGENLDGITAKIVIECPQEIKQDVLDFVKDKFKDTSFEGINVK